VQRLILQERSVTAPNSWKLLHSHFNHIDLGSQHLVQEKILSLEMVDAADAERYLGEHDALHRELIRMGVAYSDSEAIFNLLKGLPRTGTWPVFKLVLQSSLSVSAVTAVTPASSVSISKSRSVASTSAGSSSASGSSSNSSSISGILGSGMASFEDISVHIAAEAHRLVLETSITPSVGSEFTNVAKASWQANVNPATGLRHTKNNPSGVYCDTPLDNGTVCGAGNHDRAHCFKPGSGMVGQQPAHWKPFWRSKPGDSGSSASAASAVSTPPAPSSGSSAVQQPVAAAAVAVTLTPMSLPLPRALGSLGSMIFPVPPLQNLTAMMIVVPLMRSWHVCLFGLILASWTLAHLALWFVIAPISILTQQTAVSMSRQLIMAGFQCWGPVTALLSCRLGMTSSQCASVGVFMRRLPCSICCPSAGW